MLKKVLMIVASGSAIAALMVTCSQNPTQVKTTGQNSASAAVIPAVKNHNAMQALKIAAGSNVYIIGTDNHVYRYDSTTGTNSAWRKFTNYDTSASGTGYLPTLVNIAVTDDYDTIFVLGNDNKIYKHIPWHVPHDTSVKWTIADAGTAPVAKDIAAGCDVQYGGGPEVLWKLGSDNNGWEFSHSHWYSIAPKPAPRDTPLQCEKETPLTAVPTNLAVDFRGNVFGLLPVTCSQCSGLKGHIAWMYGPNGADHDTNDYNSGNSHLCPGYGYACGGLDIYGVKFVSLTSFWMSFARVTDTTTNPKWEIYTITSSYKTGVPNSFSADTQITWWSKNWSINGLAKGIGTGVQRGNFCPWVIKGSNKYVMAWDGLVQDSTHWVYP